MKDFVKVDSIRVDLVRVDLAKFDLTCNPTVINAHDQQQKLSVVL